MPQTDFIDITNVDGGSWLQLQWWSSSLKWPTSEQQPDVGGGGGGGDGGSFVRDR